MRKTIEKNEIEIAEALPEFYVPYASYVIQTRALPDARDGLKTGARFILYAQYKEKLTFKDKRRKATNTKSAAMRFSPHGDASIYSTAVRMSQDFSYRYPLIDIRGNNGSQMKNNDYAADRYLEMRSGEIAGEMLKLLEKETIDKWKLNYTEEEKYPTYFPTLFPNALVNGTFGIGVSLASSIPPHNLNDVSKALLKLIDNPNIDFDEIYCPIDFPTGAIVINSDEVKESQRLGRGAAAVVRSKVEYDEKENELVVRELPYMVFTSGATESIQMAIDEGKIQGINRVYDGTDSDGVKIIIKLNKGVNVERILKALYKHTVLQSSFGINANMLDEGKYPKIFSWREMLDTYLKHLKEVLTKAYEFDLRKILARIHILEGLLIAIKNIEEVVQIIKSSPSTAAAKQELLDRFGLDSVQAQAVLDLKLSRLVKLELDKIVNELKDLENKALEIKSILESEEKLKDCIKAEIVRIQNKYSDEHRTENINLDFRRRDDDDIEPIEKKELLIHYTNKGNLYTQETSTLLTSKRGGRGSKIKMGKDETTIKTISDDNLGRLLVFSNLGKMYSVPTSELQIGTKVNLGAICEIEVGEKITALTTATRKFNFDYFVFITKNGMIKKTAAAEYSKCSKSVKAINLKDNDEVVDVLMMGKENIGILTQNNKFIMVETKDVAAIGRNSMGRKAIKLDSDDKVIDCKKIDNTQKYICSITKNGMIKKSELTEYDTQSLNTKGHNLMVLGDGDKIVKFLTFSKDCDIIIIENQRQIQINSSELRILGKRTQGVKAISLEEKEFIVDLLKA